MSEIPFGPEPFVQSNKGYFRRDSLIDPNSYQIGDTVDGWILRTTRDRLGLGPYSLELSGQDGPLSSGELSLCFPTGKAEFSFGWKRPGR